MTFPSLVRAAPLLVCVLAGLGLSACRATSGVQQPPMVETGATRCVVLGHVENPGAITFEGDFTLFEAILQAKPKSDAGNLGHVRLIRADPRDPFVRDLDLSDLFTRGDSTLNVHVIDGDVIDVQSETQAPGSSTPR